MVHDAVTDAQLAVTTDKMVNDAVTDVTLANNAVTAVKIADAAVTGDKISATITGAKTFSNKSHVLRSHYSNSHHLIF